MVPMTSAHFIPILLDTTDPIEQKKTMRPNTSLEEGRDGTSSAGADTFERARTEVVTYALAALTKYGS